MTKQAKERKLQVEDKVLVLLPDSESKLISRWWEPFWVTRKIGQVNYEVEQPGRKNQLQIYYINILKKWVEPEGWLMSSIWADSELGPEGNLEEVKGKDKILNIGGQLSRPQWAQLQWLVQEIGDVFTKEPGKTQGVERKITILPQAV